MTGSDRQVPSTVNDTLLVSFLNQFVNQPFLEDIINVTVYQADVDTFAKRHDQGTTFDRIDGFLTDIYKDIEKLKRVNSLNNYPISLIKININLAKKIISLKQNIGSRLLTYDTLDENFTKNEIHITTLINRIKSNRIQNIDEFKDKLSLILDKIRLSEEIRYIKNGLMDLDNIRSQLSSTNCNLLNVLLDYRKAIDKASSEVTKLRSVNIKESLSNSILIGGPDYDPSLIVQNTITYLSSGYAFYKSGYDLIDQNIGGIEAANLHLICGPSNNAKSIFMINLLKSMALHNKHEFNPNDLILYITLEDDIYKLQRRFGAILGNIDQTVLKLMYVSIADLLRKKHNEGNYSLDQIESLLTNFINISLYDTVGKYAPFDLKHFREVITPDTVKQIIEYYNTQGRRVRMVFIDYVDCMAPSNSKYTDYNDYNTHGIITQELRNIAQEYLVPVITITQAVRGTENADFMTNDNIGDSIKKVRYADYIYMVRLRRDLQILSDEVKQHIIDPQELSQSITSTTFSDLQNQNNSRLTPFEVKITKAKDGDRDMMRYHVFSGNNLRIYQWLSEYYGDVVPMQQHSSKLTAEIERARMNVQTIGALPNNNVNLLL